MKGFGSLLAYIQSLAADTPIREVWHRHSLNDLGAAIIHTDFPDRAARFLGFADGFPPHNRSTQDYLLKWLPLPDDQQVLDRYAAIFNRYNCYTTLNYYTKSYALSRARFIGEEEKLKRMQSMPGTFSTARINEQKDRMLEIERSVPRDCFMDLAFDFDIGPNKMLSTMSMAIQKVQNLLAYLEANETPFKLYFSGGRGFHVVVPHQSFGQELAADNHLINEHMARLIDQSVGPLYIDYAIYSSRRQFRMENTIHQSSGLKKVRLLREDLNAGESHILTLAKPM
ncbi:MAG: hypothetical protein H8E18_04195 [FCB group bacterium]|nr:hypothetical protein [FCB group bacterium]